jgi:hypothetical protein
MGNKKKKPRRTKLEKPSSVALAARVPGAVINENRRGTLVRSIDTAIRMWFFTEDPFAIHLLACSVYMCLCDLGKHHGKGSIIEEQMGGSKMTAVYDFMRHAKPDSLDDEVDLPPVVNEWLLFDGIGLFARLFNGTSAYMRTFMAYYALRPSEPHTKLRKDVKAFLPKGVTVEEAESFGRIEFFAKLSEMFAAEMSKRRRS